MAYNTFPAYNYAAYPANSYQQQYSQAVTQNPYMGQSNAAGQQQMGIVWVDGEVGAKAYQLPSGWPANAPMPLWDTNDTIIYLKSINQMGMPNPIQKVRYTMEDRPEARQSAQSQAMLPSAEQAAPDMSEYVRKDELEQMKKELKEAITAIGTDKGAKGNGKSAV